MNKMVLYCERCQRPVESMSGQRDAYADRVFLTIRCHGQEQTLTVSGPDLINAGSLEAIADLVFGQATILHAPANMSERVRNVLARGDELVERICKTEK